MKFPSIIRSGLLLLRGLLPTIVLLVQPAAGGELEGLTNALRAEKAARAATAEKPSAEDNAKDEAKNDAKDAAKSVPWLLSLGEGHRRALAEQKPVLVRVGADWCPVCRKLAGEIDNPAVQTELARWTLVYVDADRSLEDSKELNVSVVPSLRIRTPRGGQVASRDGYLSAEDLVAWLKEHYEAAAAAPDEVLFDSDEPDPLAVVRLVRQLNSRNPAVREATIRRLLPYPKIARPAVVKTFSEGKLAARLAALELFSEWRAPVEGMDPWRPETITHQRLAALEKWLEEEVADPASELKELSDEQLGLARRQIDRMLKGTDAEAEAIRERLARLGPVLMPEVYQRLKQAGTDRDRERLLALRYRLVAGDSLVLSWPGGLLRLAATDSKQRQQAAEELAKLATIEDQQLLLELFSDPDPLVREISLRGLQNIGGKQATAALVKLLADPEPNVRAAVLKQLEEHPQPSMVPKIAEYLKKEKDPDLIVHAIRFLRAAGGREAVKSLIPLLKHESWQVRAEAAAGVGGADTSFVRLSSRNPFGGGGDTVEFQADAYAALIELLDDPDAFVVSRAVEGLSRADMAVAVEPLIKAATKHPDLASNIIEILAHGDNMRKKALPELRKFCKHEDPAIRAAAIQGVVDAAPDAMEEELAAGLQDAERTVRIAAATALFGLLDKHREGGIKALSEKAIEEISFSAGVVERETLVSKVLRILRPPGKANNGDAEKPAEDGAPAGDASGKEPGEDKNQGDEQPATSDKPPGEDDKPPGEADKPPGEADKPPGEADKPPGEADKPPGPDSPQENLSDQWLKEYYAGKRGLKWAAAMVPPLRKMLQAEDAEEKMIAAQTLVPLAEAQLALPVLREVARSSPELFPHATEVLPWLLWDDRLELSKYLRNHVGGTDNFRQLIYAMIEVPDRRAASEFWEMLADEKLTVQEAGVLQTGLMAAYLGSNYYSPSGASPADRRELAAAAKPRATAGGELQRLVALALLAAAAADEAAEVAGRLAEDPQLSDELRRDAFQVLLVTQSRKKASQTAIAALSAEDVSRRKFALTYLVGGFEKLMLLRGAFGLNIDSVEVSGRVSSSGTPIIPEPPPGLEARHVRPLIDDPDPEVAAYAGYLLALFDEPDGLDALLRYRRAQEKDERNVGRLVYRAIAVLDDATQVPVLKKIYSELDEYEVSEFYWTIRIMSGPEILKFRKKIRDELGISNLR